MAKKTEKDNREIRLINWGGEKSTWIVNFTIDGEPHQIKEDTYAKLKKEYKKLYGLDLVSTYEQPIDKL